MHPRVALIWLSLGPPGTLTLGLLYACKLPMRVVCESSLRSSGLGGMWIRRGTRPRSPGR